MKLYSKQEFEGNVLFLPQFVLDYYGVINEDCLYIDTLVDAETDVVVVDENGTEIGMIRDDDGCGTIMAFNEKDLYRVTNATDDYELLETLLGEIRTEYDDYLFRLDNFKGTISCVEYEDDDEVIDEYGFYNYGICIAKIDGINTVTGKEIHYELKN